MKRRIMRRGGLAPLALALALTAAPIILPAKVDLVTLPARDATEVTIYKAEDITLVRETRSLTFGEGLNEIQFSWANTLIDPTSLQIRILGRTADFTVLDASYPANTQNTIVWNIEAAGEGETQVEITYFASGLSWQADYSATANVEETKLSLQPNFTIFNNSGEDFTNAKTRLVVGEINIVEAIRILAERGIIPREEADRARRDMSRMVMQGRAEMYFDAMAPAAAPFAGTALMEAKEIVKAAVSEYYLYTISGTEDLETGWGKQLPDPLIEEIPIDVSYEYDERKFGPQVVKFYKFKNDEEHELGDTPLPGGTFYVYSEDGRDGLRFEARTDHKYAPIGEDIELQLGNDGMVLYERRVMSIARENFEFDRSGNPIGHDVITRMELEIRNSRTAAIPVKLRHYFSGDWEITDSQDTYKKIDRETVEWEFDVPAVDKKIIAITYVTRTGSRARTQ